MEKTVIQRFAEYLSDEKGLKANSVKQYTLCLTSLYKKKNGDILIGTSYREIADLIIAIAKERGWSARMRYKCATIAKVFFQWAMREKIIFENPFPFHDFKKGPEKEPEYFDEEDNIPGLVFNPFHRLIDTVMLSVLFDTGLRRQELLDLNIEDVDFNNRVIHVRQGKGDRWRYAPFSPKTRFLLKMYLFTLRLHYEGAALFPSSKWSRMSASQLSKHLRRLGNQESPRMKAVHLYPHKIRHSLPVRLLDNGMPEIMVQKIMGHANLNMTAKYTHLSMKNLKKNYDKFSRSQEA